MGIPVVRLGAWCDLETEDDARARLRDRAADGGGPPAAAPGEEPRPGLQVPVPGVPVLHPGSLSFQVQEFAVLADGRRVLLHAERGFGLGGPADPWQHLTLARLADDVRTTVLPDDAEQTGDEHPWDWLAQLLRAQGIAATAAELRTLPYDVEFSARVRARVAAG